ncbi:hypothetical protein EMCRGX_G022424 [Ephydatia muelleri]
MCVCMCGVCGVCICAYVVYMWCVYVWCVYLCICGVCVSVHVVCVCVWCVCICAYVVCVCVVCVSVHMWCVCGVCVSVFILYRDTVHLQNTSSTSYLKATRIYSLKYSKATVCKYILCIRISSTSSLPPFRLLKSLGSKNGIYHFKLFHL